MLLTVKELSVLLNIGPSTLYLWAGQGKIPCRKIHGLVRFDQQDIGRWLASFSVADPAPPRIQTRRSDNDNLDRVIARAKRAVYTPRHGETRPKSSLIGKGERDGAREA